ncbi:hypothetical protein [Pseudomonas nitroreducens]|uniref:hypothetical protein n=1 Tax=Pseudomonas nitroreducens TaxID=46680 RepID=UPI003466B4FC
MPEENIISISSVMDQAQVFASAWSLVGGPFDNGDAWSTPTMPRKSSAKCSRCSSPTPS